jgi:methionyl-tRNA formyltransferase
MRIAVLGTGPFAVPMFAALLGSRHEITALITRPTPPPKGREKSPPNPMRDLAESRGLTIHSPDSINSDEGVAILRQLAPDLLVVCDYGQILSPQALSVAPLGGINLHASLLPKYRGAAPIHWALLNGERETGVSVVHMTPRLDGGPILVQQATTIGVEETQPELEQRLASIGVEAVQEAIAQLEQWDRTSPIGALQDTSQATKAPRLRKEMGAVDWSKSSEQIRNQIRALKPWPGTFTFWLRAGQEPLRLVIDAANVMDVADSSPGKVVVSNGQQLVVATGNQGLSIAAIAPAGKRHMSVAEFLRGYRVQVGDRFGPNS